MTFTEAARHVRDRHGESERRPYLPIERLAQELWRDDQDMRGTFIASLFEHRTALIERSPAPASVPITSVLPLTSRGDADLVLTMASDIDRIDAVIEALQEELYDGALLERAAEAFRAYPGSGHRRWRHPPARHRPGERRRTRSAVGSHHDEAVDDDRPVHEWIAEHATRTPEQDRDHLCRPALEPCRAGAARQLSSPTVLLAAGTGPRSALPCMVKRSPETIAAILAVLKAGGAYIPVEPDQPPARNHHDLSATPASRSS